MGETEMNIYFCLLYNETKSMPNQLVYTEFVRFLTKDIFLNCLLKKQSKLHFSPFYQSIQHLALVSA